MREFIGRYYKRLEIVVTIVALSVFLVGNAIEGSGYAVRVIPYVILLAMSFVSNFSKVNARVLVWILMGVEFLCTHCSGIGLYYFYPYTVREILGEFMFYETSIAFIVCIQIFLMILMPFLRKGGIIIYSSGMCILYLLAVILDGGISITLAGGVLYYIAFMLFANELTPNNKLQVYSRLWDYIIETESGDIEEDYPLGPDDFIEEAEEDTEPGHFDLLEKFLQLMSEEETKKKQKKDLKASLQKAVDQHKEEIVMKGSRFLLDDYEQSEIMYKLENEGDTVCMSAVYSHHFLEKDAGDMLKKKSILNQTFEDLGYSCRANAELDIADLSDGVFAICLPKCEFSNEDGEKLVDAMFEFMKMIVLLNNAKIY